MRVDKKFAPKTISIDSIEDERFIYDMIAYAQECLYSKSRWIGKPRKVDEEMNEKLILFRKLLA